ncbi:hypothetical protein VQH23_12525 [Pararoseomonas sp. SCSIO 73927]|uniref:hypothetical protein n=1 Tax=Pararoseomonas sp. SCSIO 73927 TaxID=3114537 RepID=UPI0030CE9BB6
MPPDARATEQLHQFRPADAEALRAWDGLLQQDSSLRQDARRHRFRPRLDLSMLRVDLDGDRQPELVLYADLLPYCGSAGCVARILTRREGRWVLACETHVEGDNGFIVDSARSSSWRNLRGTYRMTWRANGNSPAGVACVEGETVPRSEQAKPIRRPR